MPTVPFSSRDDIETVTDVTDEHSSSSLIVQRGKQRSGVEARMGDSRQCVK